MEESAKEALSQRIKPALSFFGRFITPILALIESPKT
jgi:hypothetical protein